MKPRFFIATSALLLLALSVTACFPLTAGPRVDQAATQNAQILLAVKATATTSAMQTQIASLQTQVAAANAGLPNSGQSQPPTLTPPATIVSAATSEATFTPLPTDTPYPTATPAPTDTPVPPTFTPIPTATPIPCNAAQFVSDVSVPDGTIFSPGSTFNKTWRLKNSGACTWTTGYNIVFMGGAQMSSTTVYNLTGTVVPGQMIDITVPMTAPSSNGQYRSDWKLRDTSGLVFGVGKSGSAFYALIKVVVPQSDYPLDFIARMCDADWTSGAGTLPCPGIDGDSRGFELRYDNPTLESGYVDNEPVLVTQPQMVYDGVIRGKYPAFNVVSGDHFMTVIGCAYRATSCDVNFKLDYQIGSGSIGNLKTWHEVYDKNTTTVDIDLSSLAGQSVKFILTVMANGSATGDRAQWLLPRIVKK